MSNNFFELGMTPPHGVAFVQWADGSIRIRYCTKDVIPLREMLLGLARGLTEQAINKLQTEKQAELDRQKIPLTRMETIDQELKTLKANAVDLDPLDPSLLLMAAEMPPPTVVVSKVVREVADSD